MGDLIDLKSPDGKPTVSPKLASPLIPAPTKLLNNEKIDVQYPGASSGLNFVKRNSLDNNPFDNALHKTVDYARKQDDPFEVVLEKALKYKDANVVTTPKARSVEFKDDFTPKRTRYSDILKMNKTLDDLSIEAELGVSRKKISLSPCGEDSIIHDLDNTSLLGGSSDNTELGTIGECNVENSRTVPSLCLNPPSPNDLSILNHSAMNDSLTESSENSEESLIKSIVAKRISLCIQKGTSEANNLVIPNKLLKSQKLRRASSQSTKSSPLKFRQQRSRSIVDSLKAGMGNDNDNSICSMPSIVFEDNMNKAFLESQLKNDNSTISDLSNVSAIMRLNSVSSAYNSSHSSSAFSNRTANCAFIESSTDNLSAANNFYDKSDARSFSVGRLSSAGSTFKSPSKETSINNDITELLSKYSHLAVTSHEIPINEVSTARLPSIISGSGLANGTADKLIDVDVFVPATEESPPMERNQRRSVSSTSSDSVFLDSNTVGRSIIAEANCLAKTFEELAARTSSSCSSSGSDLINSRPRWNFDLLPVSDDDALVDDLIDLPNSPMKHDTEKATEEKSATNRSSSSSEAKSDKSMIKELESEFIAPEKKKIASSLLIELENLVKSEGNPEAIKLLENLEKALGVHCRNNSELLASCFTTRNDLTKSPRRLDDPLGNENIKDESNEKSCEDNINVESSESIKQLSLSDEKSFQNNFNNEKEINKSDKSLVLANEKYDKDSHQKLSPNGIIEDSCDDTRDDSISDLKKEKQITDDQKMAVEILVGLGKLLTGQNKDSMTADVLKNLGRVLNLASSNNCDLQNIVQTSVKESKRVDTLVKKNRVATPPRKSTPLSAFSRSANRRSLESSMKAKTANDHLIRNSISGVQTPTSTTPRLPIKPLSADKSKAHLKEVKKRFSSDPGAAAEKKRYDHAVNNRKSSKDIPIKPTSDLTRQKQPSSTVADTVKSKFRKKTDSDVTSKRGPMKALLPLGNMQRQKNRVSPLTESTTPPKPGREGSSPCSVSTSTPFPNVHISCPKKSTKSKPMASSTPDGGAPKSGRRSAPPIPQSPSTNGFTCNISPVTSKSDEADDDNSSKDNSKSSKLSKIGTPSKSRSVSQLPKLSPMLGMKSSPNKSPRGQRRSEPLQSFLPRSFNPPKSPSICITDTSSSPLNNSNKLGSKVKPLNLISKLRGRSVSVTEKENYA